MWSFFYSFIIKIFFKHTNIYNNNPLVLNTWGLLLYMLIKKKVMDNKTLKNIFNFIEINEGKKTPFVWKLINNDPFTEDELNIKGDLELQGQDIQELPDGIYVKNDLLLNSTPIKKLPKGLRVGDNLYIQYTKITSLPEGLQVGGNLHIYDTTLAKLSDEELREMVKPGFIKGRIYR